MTDPRLVQTVHQGRFLKFLTRGTWEYVERCHVTGTVGIIAVTDDEKVVLIEQFRPPLQKNVIEIPAGLAGDVVGSEKEEMAEAAKRELLEETGYAAARMEYLTEGPSSAGLSTEVISLFLASGLSRTGTGGGDDSEKIIVHEIPLKELHAWLQKKQDAGCLVDYKVFTGLYFYWKARGKII